MSTDIICTANGADESPQFTAIHTCPDSAPASPADASPLYPALLVVVRYMGALPIWTYAGLLVCVIVARRLLVAPYARFLLRWLAPEMLVDAGQRR